MSALIDPNKGCSNLEIFALEPKTSSCPEEENVEAICLLFNRIGKQLDANQKAKRIIDVYFGRLNVISVNPELASRIRFVVLDVIWVPRREEVIPKTIAEIHLEAERDMGLHPAATASFTRARRT